MACYNIYIYYKIVMEIDTRFFLFLVYWLLLGGCIGVIVYFAGVHPRYKKDDSNVEDDDEVE